MSLSDVDISDSETDEYNAAYHTPAIQVEGHRRLRKIVIDGGTGGSNLAKTLFVEAGSADCVAILSTYDTERSLSSLRVTLRHPFQSMAVLYGHQSGLSCLVKELKRQCDRLFYQQTNFAEACRRVLPPETSSTYPSRTPSQVDMRRLVTTASMSLVDETWILTTTTFLLKSHHYIIGQPAVAVAFLVLSPPSQVSRSMNPRIRISSRVQTIEDSQPSRTWQGHAGQEAFPFGVHHTYS
ncbi:hypothetical protein M436DRAFT_65039 [Aureobasidium namibiae CBS 147.97]|uniref:Uncharacterized protein n=1 Tax=Aureobasidium namibiae CBS 147.97 TaxID=1043004 RepID=A0A074WGQ6_9PEZI|nr:uncharacterized protein M436DRAFT_65039 [Aureobasidium namibiae CBS 147.97]KEQ72275.1 hypothetical protein M436DRAFT_65039 [Aureobasidium namibiae CBS 147.97]